MLHGFAFTATQDVRVPGPTGQVPGDATESGDVGAHGSKMIIQTRSTIFKFENAGASGVRNGRPGSADGPLPEPVGPVHRVQDWPARDTAQVHMGGHGSTSEVHRTRTRHSWAQPNIVRRNVAFPRIHKVEQGASRRWKLV